MLLALIVTLYTISAIVMCTASLVSTVYSFSDGQVAALLRQALQKYLPDPTCLYPTSTAFTLCLFDFREHTLKHFFVICCAVLGLFACELQAQQPAASSATTEQLQQLTDNKLNQSMLLLQSIAGREGTNMLPLYQALLRGQLYYIKHSMQIITVRKSGSIKHYNALFDDTAIAALPSNKIKKIRVNNKIRGFLRQHIAKLKLSAKDPEVRLAALQSLLIKLTPDTIANIAQLRLSEKNHQVQQLMDLALTIDRALNNRLAIEQVSAIKKLQGSLEPQVRNTLTSLNSTKSHPSVQKAAQQALLKIEQSTEFYGYLEQLFFGLSLGSVLLLAAIGLAITFGMMGVINMAHGEMIMIGAYTTYVVQLLMPNMIEYSLWVAIPLAFVVSGSVGVLIERCVIRFLHGRPLETLLATFGISLILQQLVRSIFSPLNRQVASPAWMSGSWEINPVFSLTLNRLYILAFALLVFFALLFILKKTSLGLNVRAVSQNRDMAKAMGIRTGWVDAMTFGLGSGIAGIAGVALSQLTNVGPNLGQAYIIDSFMVVVFGGVGNLFGTLVAAFSLGIANKLLEPSTGAVLASIFVLVFIILFIQKRPKGLFPQKGRAVE